LDKKIRKRRIFGRDRKNYGGDEIVCSQQFSVFLNSKTED